MQTDTELANLEDINDDLKKEKLNILQEYNQYLIFMEEYFKNKNAKPLKSGSELVKQIFR